MSMEPKMDGERRLSDHGRAMLGAFSILLTVLAGAVLAPAGLAAPVEAVSTVTPPLATPTQTNAPVPAAPAAGVLSGPPTDAQMSKMMSEMHDLTRLMQATMTIMQVLQQGQPTEDEIAALQAQVRVVGVRLTRLMAEVHAARMAAGVRPAPTPVSPSPLPTVQALQPTEQALPPTAPTQPPTAPLATATPAPAPSMMDMMSEMMSMMSGMMGGGAMGEGGTAGAPAPGPGTQPVDPALVRQAQAGAVGVKVYPTNLRVPGLASLDFYLTLETHTVSLAFDLAQSATLRLPSGLEVQAVKWLGPAGGHHVEGTLSFPALDSNGASLVPPAGILTLVIRNIPGASEQIFVWDLAQTP